MNRPPRNLSAKNYMEGNEMRNKPPNKECPLCGHKFRNYQWRRSFKYDGSLACCPWCKTPAVEFTKIRKEQALKGKEEQTTP